MRRALLTIVWLALFPIIPTGATMTETFAFDLAYGDHPRQRLNLYIPANAPSPAPVIITIHGGGFVQGDKSDVGWVNGLGDAVGAAVVSFNYRLAPAHPYPAAVEDSFCALAWVHAHAAEYGLDVTRIATWGWSAGGNLALMLGTVSDPAQYLAGCNHTLPTGATLAGTVAYFSVVNPTSSAYPHGSQWFLNDYLIGVAPEQAAESSVLHWINGDEPPLLLIHGTADTVVPFAESQGLADALTNAGRPVDFMVFDGIGHGDFGEQFRRAREAEIAFLRGRLNSTS
ncbi:MAG: alpha/beta hydrolase fold domain-containing protein [Phototrophicaceae bacterium]